MSKNVKYCSYYNEICNREWCQKNKGCGAGASVHSGFMSAKEAMKKIEEKRKEKREKDIERWKKIFEKEGFVVHTKLEIHSKNLELLDRYSKFLEEHGYMDCDWRAEEPKAIDEFIRTDKK